MWTAFRKKLCISSPLLTGRSIVQERHPSFDGSFVETCLLLIGKISCVWERLGDASEALGYPVTLPVVQTGGCMLDMLLAPAGCHAPSARASGREAFRFVGLQEERKATDISGAACMFVSLCVPSAYCSMRTVSD